MTNHPLEKFHLYLSAAAAVVVLLACIAIGAELHWMAFYVSVTIVSFYVIGQFLRYFLMTKVFPPQEETPGDEEFFDIEPEEDDADDDTDIDADADVDADADAEEEDEELGDVEENEPVEDAFLDS